METTAVVTILLASVAIVPFILIIAYIAKSRRTKHLSRLGMTDDLVDIAISSSFDSSSDCDCDCDSD